MSRDTVALDVSTLPRIVFGNKGLVWWGTTGLVVIESSAFAMLLVIYYYLRGRVPEWPPAYAPALRWGTTSLVVFLLSIIPNYLTKKAAERFDLPRVRLWLTISTLFALGAMIPRYYEFGALNVRWDTNAYGSIVWVLIGTHTMHLVTDWYDTFVINIIAFTGPVDGKRFIDFSDNAMYWFFVVFSWIPIYVTVYLAPYFL
jgi:heme/copper-type cytochrome/quinol oxidase subunit 3